MMIDAKKLADEMMDLADHFASTLEQPNDPRAWDHLLIYAPRDALERRLKRLDERRLAVDEI
jgi:hypothetical protein